MGGGAYVGAGANVARWRVSRGGGVCWRGRECGGGRVSWRGRESSGRRVGWRGRECRRRSGWGGRRLRGDCLAGARHERENQRERGGERREGRLGWNGFHLGANSPAGCSGTCSGGTLNRARHPRPSPLPSMERGFVALTGFGLHTLNITITNPASGRLSRPSCPNFRAGRRLGRIRRVGRK